jgi:hypothetical protein
MMNLVEELGFFFAFLVNLQKRREEITMVCQTVKVGTDCIFMTRKGCTYNGGACHPIIDNCSGCGRVAEYPAGLYCKAYSEPALKWAPGPCGLATHVKRSNGTVETKKLNPLKASKRKSRRK